MDSAYEPIAEIMKRSLVLLEVCGAQTVADHHVIAFENFVDHRWRCISWVGIVAVRHDVHVGVNIFEHGSNDIAFALSGFFAHYSAFRRSDFRSAVSGIIVVNVDVCLRQSSLEIANDLTDGHFLVIAGK